LRKDLFAVKRQVPPEITKVSTPLSVQMGVNNRGQTKAITCKPLLDHYIPHSKWDAKFSEFAPILGVDGTYFSFSIAFVDGRKG